MKHKRKRPGKPAGMNYADVLKTRRDRLQLAMDEAALLLRRCVLSFRTTGALLACIRVRRCAASSEMLPKTA